MDPEIKGCSQAGEWMAERLGPDERTTLRHRAARLKARQEPACVAAFLTFSAPETQSKGGECGTLDFFFFFV